MANSTCVPAFIPIDQGYSDLNYYRVTEEGLVQTYLHKMNFVYHRLSKVKCFSGLEQSMVQTKVNWGSIYIEDIPKKCQKVRLLSMTLPCYRCFLWLNLVLHKKDLLYFSHFGSFIFVSKKVMYKVSVVEVSINTSEF